jgi:opacity protein-like surface antigen
MNKYFLFLMLILALSLVKGQSVNKGDIVLNVNIGAPHLFKSLVKVAVKTPAFQENFSGVLEVSDIHGLNPLAFKGEYGFGKVFALGLNYSTWNLGFDVKDYYNVQNQNGAFVKDSFDVYTIKITSTSFGLRPILHLPFENFKHDIYFGLGLGITKNSLSIGFSSTDAGRFAKKFNKDLEVDLSLPGGMYFAPSVGYRNYFNPFFGVNIELGYEKGAIIQGGFVFRFNHYKEVRDKQKSAG